MFLFSISIIRFCLALYNASQTCIKPPFIRAELLCLSLSFSCSPVVFKVLSFQPFNSLLNDKNMDGHIQTKRICSWLIVKPPTTFLTYISRGYRQKYARLTVRLNRSRTQQPPGHESDKLTTELPGRGERICSWLIVKPPTTFLTYISRGYRQKYARLTVRLNRSRTQQPPGHESDKLTTELPGRGERICR